MKTAYRSRYVSGHPPLVRTQYRPPTLTQCRQVPIKLTNTVRAEEILIPYLTQLKEDKNRTDFDVLELFN